MADRVQAYDQSSPPWAYPHTERTADSPSPERDRRQPHRTTTAPERYPMNQWHNPAVYPVSLFPGQRPPQTVHSPDIYFSQNMNQTPYNPPYPMRPANNTVSNAAAQFYPQHQYQYYGVQQTSLSPPPAPPTKPSALQQEMRREPQHAPLHPALYRSFTSPPPLPPKPSLIFEPEPAAIPTSTYLGGHSSNPTAATAAFTSPPLQPPVPPPRPPPPVVPPPTTETPEEESGDDLAVALALSKDESMREEERMRELAQREDEELQRALAASMSVNGGDYFDSQPKVGPSTQASDNPPSPVPAAGPFTTTELPASSSSSATGYQNSIQENSASPSQQLKAPNEEQWPDERLPREDERKSTDEAAIATTPRVMESPSVDPGVLALEADVPPGYSPPPRAPDRTPTSLASIRTINQPKPDNSNMVSDGDDNDDEDDNDYDEGLPYLRGKSRDKAPDSHLSVDPYITQPPGPSNQSELSPITASFGVLSYDDSYIDEDEALARRLTEEEEAAYQESQHNGRKSSESNLSRNTSVASAVAAATESGLPTYMDAVSIGNSDTIPMVSARVPEVKVDIPSTPVENGNLTRNLSINSGTSIASEPAPLIASSSKIPFPGDGPQAVTTLHPGEPQRVIGRTSSMSALPSAVQSRDDLPPLPAEDPSITPTTNLSQPSPTTLKSKETEEASASGSLGMLNATHFVDAELLFGVSINFSPPVISAKLAPMQGPMPTLISLPYGRCPPLHFQAPSWRHMLKLMARLSSTKIEPSIEAMAVNRNEVLKLRTVIQFLKPHHMAHEWRTILWFTIDHPVPSNLPNAHRYQTTNVNILPFSYTLSSIPAVLRDASDTAISKTYTIPATAAFPYPSLPITFPNLAMYLQAALDDSRKQNDSSPSRKLAKMVQTCYPNEFVSMRTDEPDKSGGVGGLFKKVMNRGKKTKKGGGGGNEETYDLVTPFVPDEWGS